MKLLALTIATAALLSASTFAQDSPSTTRAEAAALAWLALVDAGNYSESWKQAADTLSRRSVNSLGRQKSEKLAFPSGH